MLSIPQNPTLYDPYTKTTFEVAQPKAHDGFEKRTERAVIGLLPSHPGFARHNMVAIAEFTVRNLVPAAIEFAGEEAEDMIGNELWCDIAGLPDFNELADCTFAEAALNRAHTKASACRRLAGDPRLLRLIAVLCDSRHLMEYLREAIETEASRTPRSRFCVECVAWRAIGIYESLGKLMKLTGIQTSDIDLDLDRDLYAKLHLPAETAGVR